MNRRTRLIIKATATGVIVGSVALARLLSDDDVATFGIAQAVLFLAFGVSSIVLFAVVVTDFDRWTETVPPVPRRIVRRHVGRVTRRIRRGGAWALAIFGAVMTWFWSKVGAALGAVLSTLGDGLTSFWSATLRAGVRTLILYGAVMHRLWTAVGHGLAWIVVRSGRGLTVTWAWAVRAGLRTLVVYRAVMHPVWATVGHGFAWVVLRSGRGLTVVWAWAVRAGVRTLVVYRAGMQWLWSTAARAIRWAASRAATALRVVWTGMARAAVWTFGRSRSGLGRAWLAIAGRGDEPTPKPIRRWYRETVDAAFGIPPDGTSVDVFGGRVAPPGRTSRERETVGAPAPRTREGTDDDAVL